MSFASRLTRSPIAYEPARAEEALARFAGLSADLRALLEGTAGCSPYLSGLMLREADWLEEALAGAPEAALAAELGRLDGVEGDHQDHSSQATQSLHTLQGRTIGPSTGCCLTWWR